MVKLALLTFAKHQIDKGYFPDKTFKSLKAAYSLVNVRFRENADQINKEFRHLVDVGFEDMDLVRDFDSKYGSSVAPGSVTSQSIQADAEFNNFVVDCMGK